jgi:hypothetical protein
LPTFKRKDAIYTYPFTICYSVQEYLSALIQSDGLDAGESRFITQLGRKQPNHHLTHEIYNAALPNSLYANVNRKSGSGDGAIKRNYRKGFLLRH